MSRESRLDARLREWWERIKDGKRVRVRGRDLYELGNGTLWRGFQKRSGYRVRAMIQKLSDHGLMAEPGLDTWPSLDAQIEIVDGSIEAEIQRGVRNFPSHNEQHTRALRAFGDLLDEGGGIVVRAGKAEIAGREVELPTWVWEALVAAVVEGFGRN